MKVNLFGVGIKSKSPAITAQRRINCYVDVRQEADKTNYAVIGRFGLDAFVTSLGNNITRGMWAVNTLATPLLFVVQSSALYSVTNVGATALIGTIGTTSGDVSLADDGKFLVLVDGLNGWVYNMQVPAGLTKITDGNFTTAPRTVTWQDQYFIVASMSSTRQFQLSQISPTIDPTIWPSVQINFAGTSPGVLQNGQADHSILNLFGDVYTEFWQDTGSPDFPYALIPGSAQEFGLAAPFSLVKFDNALVGLFQNKMGAINVSRVSGFSLHRLSTSDLEQILSTYGTVAGAEAFAFQFDGHPMYLINFPNQASWMYDGLSNIWTEIQATDGSPFWGTKFANFQNRLLVSDRRNGNIYQLDDLTYSDNGSSIPMELWTRHIWNDDKYIGIQQVQIDVEGGVGLVTGQGVNPVYDLQVSKDGGNSFYSVGYSSVGAIGQFTQRLIWNTLGAARDWVLKLRITDPVKRIITGASAEITNARL